VAVAGLALVATVLAGNRPELGLDLQGGASVVLQPPDGADSGVLDQAIEVIRSRVDALGVAEPDITRQGDAIVVELPGVSDQQRAIELVGQTAELRFRPVLATLPPEGTPPETTTTAPAETTTTVAGETTTTTVDPGAVPTTDPADNTADAEVVLPMLDEDGNVIQRYRLGPTEVTGAAIEGAEARLQPGGVQWTVDLVFTEAGIDDFNALAATCAPPSATCPPSGVNQQTGAAAGSVAIELDGIVQSAPTINAAGFTRDQVVISGGFGEDEAKDLALVLRYGALPVQLEQASASTVSASLGEDSLRAGIIAGALGTALVLLYIVAYYRSLGVVVLLGLCVWAALQWSVISYLGASRGLALSLAGATGLIVSVGITVDSYIVYFERLKDELARGRSVRSAVDRGFKQAFRTILTADAAAFMGAALLYTLTVGPVRGFAFFLGLSTVLDVLVAYFFTRPLVAILARKGFFASGFLATRGRSPSAAATIPVGGAS
jgi:preprotein translocase subunit SecD